MGSMDCCRPVCGEDRQLLKCPVYTGGTIQPIGKLARIARNEDMSIMLMFTVLICQFIVFQFLLNTIEGA
jgi:hypothetical protein